MKKERVIIRGYRDNVLIVEDRAVIDEELTELEALAEIHAHLLKDGPCMIEVEFLDEPDVQQRFIRFGTDPRRMVKPLAVDLDDLKPKE